jgi:transcriptional regulator with XRE-family HTH domain
VKQEKKIQIGVFSDRLKTLMERRGVYPAQVARALGMPQPVLHRYVMGQLPRVENLVPLARYFGVSIEYLLGLTDELPLEAKEPFKPVTAEQLRELVSDSQFAESRRNKGDAAMEADRDQWKLRSLEMETQLREAQARASRLEAELMRSRMAVAQPSVGRSAAAAPPRVSLDSATPVNPPADRGAEPAPVAGLGPQRIKPSRGGLQDEVPFVRDQTMEALRTLGRKVRAEEREYRGKRKEPSTTDKAAGRSGAP